MMRKLAVLVEAFFVNLVCAECREPLWQVGNEPLWRFASCGSRATMLFQSLRANQYPGLLLNRKVRPQH